MEQITLEVRSSTQVKAFIPFTAVPDSWAGKRVVITLDEKSEPATETQDSLF